MKQSLLVTTAVAVLIGTGALAQSPNERPPAPSAAQSQPNANSPAAQAPAPSSAGSAVTSQNAQSAPANNRQDTTTGQSAPNPRSPHHRDRITMRRRRPHRRSPRSRRLLRRRRPIHLRRRPIRTGRRPTAPTTQIPTPMPRRQISPQTTKPTRRSRLLPMSASRPI